MEEKTHTDSQLKQGYLYAVRLLTASKKSEKEILKRLLEKGYAEEVGRGIIQTLKTQGILSNQKLAEETIQLATQVKRYGRNRIFLELRKKGVSETDIARSLEHYPKALERENAEALASERWERLKHIEPQKRKKRLYDFLAARGFDFELCRELVNQMETKKNEDV